MLPWGKIRLDRMCCALQTMQTVILYGGLDDASLTLPLCRALEHLGGVVYFGPGRAAAYADCPPRFLLWETDTLLCCDIPRPLVLLKQGARPPQGLSPLQQAVVLGGQILPALSSLGEQSAVVELRRPLPRIDGSMLDAGEYTVELSAPMEGYALLACCAVELWAGKT